MSTAPDYILKSLNRVTEERSARIGCAWKNPDGSLTLVLDTHITLAASRDMLLTLFPNDRKTANLPLIPNREGSPFPACPGWPSGKDVAAPRKPKKGSMAALKPSVVHKINED